MDFLAPSAAIPQGRARLEQEAEAEAQGRAGLTQPEAAAAGDRELNLSCLEKLLRQQHLHTQPGPERAEGSWICLWAQP